MIERGIIQERIKRWNIKKKIRNTLRKSAGLGDVEIETTPLGERITLQAVKPGLVIGSGGKNVKAITKHLKENYYLENPQIKVNEVSNPFLSAKIVAEMIASKLERFGVGRFKATGYRALESIMSSGAVGAEIRISGKVPSARSRSWRFFAGYLKKCGETSNLIDSAISLAKVKSGAIGIKVSIMPPGIRLPDSVEIRGDIQLEEETPNDAKNLKEEVKEAIVEDKSKQEKKPKTKKVKPKKKASKKSEKKSKKSETKEEKKEKPKVQKSDSKKSESKEDSSKKESKEVKDGNDKSKRSKKTE